MIELLKEKSIGSNLIILLRKALNLHISGSLKLRFELNVL